MYLIRYQAKYIPVLPKRTLALPFSNAHANSLANGGSINKWG